MSEFVFATCLPGLEPALKREIARTRPELRFAYSRPGLLTFKAPGAVDLDAPGAAFARVWGRSLGAAATPDDARAQLAAAGVARVHVFPREEAADLAPWAGAPAGDAQVGELVGDVVVAPGAGEPAWLGVHRHRADLPAGPGGSLGVVLPEDAPSRAYAKIEEAIAWARLPVAVGQVAVEIGAAPGGAALALARRGVTVWGVDTGELAPGVVAYAHPSGARVHHLAHKVGAVRWEQLPAVVDWLLVDVNLAPPVAVHEISRLMPKLRASLRGAVFTLKMNDWSLVDQLPKLTARIAELGLPEIRLRHLPSNRREICCVALPR